MKNEQIKKLNKLRREIIDIDIYEYINNLLKNLYIEITGNYEGNTLYLMKRNLLEGWCWQTTESTIIFFNDDDYICRGNLKLDKNTTYYHSWICFNYQNKEFVFDPCLNILCKKKLYDKVFQVKIISKLTAKTIKEDLINKILNKTQKKDEVLVTGNDKDDINEPMYRNYTGYTANIENNQIKALKAHYYKRLY